MNKKLFATDVLVLEASTKVAAFTTDSAMASDTAPGLVSTGSQTISGIKTFLDVISGDISGNAATVTSVWNTYTTASASAPVASRDQVFWDTTSSLCTAVLPSSPSLGDVVRLIDFKGTWGTNKLTVSRNGNKIQGASSDLDLTIPYDCCTLVFDGVDNWHLVYG